MDIYFTPENAEKITKFYCKNCDFKCCKQSDYDRHISTQKHKNTIKDINDIEKTPKHAEHNICSCGKIYKNYSSLWRHKKTCNNGNSNIGDNNESTDKELIMLLIKENSELKNMMMKVIENGTHNVNNVNNITNTNSHNKAFNLNFFLNETCKNAMNINEFVDSIKLQLSDLESVGKIGYVEGLSKIIIKNLNALDVTERPVHCSDSKRDTMYVKDEDKWEKESEKNERVLKAIEDIANKNSKMVKEWKTKNPECASSKSNKADQYSHIMIQAVCSNNDANNNKILKKIAKEVTIDKS